ncbi:MAG: MFS transporter [Candidatus Dojkabacteria bacterium]|nr:MFS transporter [Candidatus Dojkabacteria bacterium]
MHKLFKFNRRYNKRVRILLITNSLVMIASAMFGPIYALFVEDIGGDLLDASIVFAAFSLASAIITYSIGDFTDKTKEKELIIVAGYFIIGFGFLSMLLAKSILVLLITQIIIGAGWAIFSPAFDVVFTEHLNNKKAGKDWGAWETLYYFTSAFGALTGGLLVTYLGFHFMFIVMALLCFLSAGYIYFLPRKVL